MAGSGTNGVFSFDSAPDFLKLPDHIYMGEAAGVATNSKGHVFVYSRSGTSTVTLGTSSTARKSRRPLANAPSE